VSLYSNNSWYCGRDRPLGARNPAGWLTEEEEGLTGAAVVVEVVKTSACVRRGLLASLTAIWS
jgi:hypothetical protein